MEKQAQVGIYLSVVIPLYNEESNIPALLEQLEYQLKFLQYSYEIILVDDGSNDKTWQVLHGMAEENNNIKAIKLARNFGHQHALLAGLSRAEGQAIISMDGDLQHPPSLIPKMVDSYKQGNLVVNTFRDDVEVASFFKRKTSSIFYKFFSFLTDVKVDTGLSDFRLIDRTVLLELLQLKDVDLFLRGAVEWLGFKSVTLPYKANKRFSGASKYTLSTMLKFARGSIVSFSTKPLVLGIWIGSVTSFLAFVEIIYILIQVAYGETVPGWASTVSIISFLFGVLFIVLGIIGIYLARIHTALQNRPRFIIQDEVQNTNRRNIEY
jgi:glycosyltransferase involved in cell wall biosynthesis